MNEDTGEVQVSEPAQGYVDKEGNLHLESGEVVPNPLLHMTDEERRALKEKQRCSECELNDSSRLCDQCGDQFCAACWVLVHVGPGKRKDHTFVPINRPECAECLEEWAQRHSRRPLDLQEPVHERLHAFFFRVFASFGRILGFYLRMNRPRSFRTPVHPPKSHCLALRTKRLPEECTTLGFCPIF